MICRFALSIAMAMGLAVCGAAQGQSNSEIYARACREAVGPIPEFSCADGVSVPVTVDGAPVSAPKPGMDCDRPALLNNGEGSDGQCVPNSRILSLSTTRLQAAVMCRQKRIRSADSMEFDEIDVIAHNPATGATCWFQAGGPSGLVNGARAPSPTGATGGGYWRAPEAVAQEGCGRCHDSGPFMFSPFVGQVWRVMPSDPFGPYYHVDPASFGFAVWPTEQLAPRDNACLGCHRIGTGETCRSLTQWMTGRAIPEAADAWARRYPGSHAMPPGLDVTQATWANVYAQAVDELLSCCRKPDQAACNREKAEKRAD